MNRNENGPRRGRWGVGQEETLQGMAACSIVDLRRHDGYKYMGILVDVNRQFPCHILFSPQPLRNRGCLRYQINPDPKPDRTDPPSVKLVTLLAPGSDPVKGEGTYHVRLGCSYQAVGRGGAMSKGERNAV